MGEAVTDGSRPYFVHPEQRDRILRRALAAKDYVQDEVEYRRRDGPHFTANLHMRVAHSENGAFVEGFVEDISSRKKAEETRNRYARRLIAQEEELRKNIAMELHDDVGQEITALALNLAYIGKHLGGESGIDLRPTLDDSRMLAKDISRTVRNLMNTLRPSQLDEYGLVSAIRSYVGQYTQRVGFAVTVQASADFPRLGPKKEIALFRIFQEALNNVAKHADATNLLISLDCDADSVQLSVTDDGTGLVPHDAPQSSGSGHGLTIMRERAELVGGTFRLDAVPGQGTSLVIDIRTGGKNGN